MLPLITDKPVFVTVEPPKMVKLCAESRIETVWAAAGQDATNQTKTVQAVPCFAQEVDFIR